MSVRFHLVIGVLIAVCLTGCGELKEEKVSIGYRGEARYNSYLAAEKFLVEYGYEADGIAGLVGIPEEGEILVLGSNSISARGMVDKLVRWVEDGGHLIYLVEPESGLFARDWDIDGGSPHPLLDEFGVEIITDTSWDNGRVEIDGEEFELNLSRTIAFDLESAYGNVDLVVGEMSSSRLASMEYEYGRLSVINRSGILHNDEIGEGDHAAVLYNLAWRSLSWNVTFVYGRSGSFWRMAWDEGWMVIVPLIAFIVFWLWKNLPRLGPVIREEENGLRHFGDHIGMVGHFLWRQRASDALLSPVRERIRRHCQKRHFHNLAPPPGELVTKLSQLSGLTAERVSDALNLTGVRDQALYVRLTQDLQQMETSI